MTQAHETARKSARSRQRILECALACFKDKGFARTTIADICAAAGISPGHLYYYFKSKADMIAEIAHRDSLATAQFFHAMTDTPDVVDGILTIADAGTDVGDYGLDGSLALDVYSEATRDPVIATLIQTESGASKALLQARLSQGQRAGQIDPSLDTQAAAILLFALFEGLPIAEISFPDMDTRALAPALGRLISRFLRPDDHQAPEQITVRQVRTSRNRPRSPGAG